MQYHVKTLWKRPCGKMVRAKAGRMHEVENVFDVSRQAVRMKKTDTRRETNFGSLVLDMFYA